MADVLITWPEVVAIANAVKDELEDIPVATQNELMEQAAAYTHVKVIVSCSGFKRFIGQPEHDVFIKAMQMYRAAHLGANVDVDPAGEGAQTGENIGSVSLSRNQAVNNPQADQGFLETIYGRNFHDYLETYKNALKEISEHSVVGFGTFSNGKTYGMPVFPPLCS